MRQYIWAILLAVFMAALLLLQCVQGPVVTDPAVSAPDEHGSQRATWRISSGIDYYHLEDVDTSGMTAEELLDYQRLTEIPLSVWLRAKSTIRPEAAFVGEISPEVYISDRKSRLSVSARSSFLENFLHLEPSVKAEKWYHNSVQDARFAGSMIHFSESRCASVGEVLCGRGLRVTRRSALRPSCSI